MPQESSHSVQVEPDASLPSQNTRYVAASLDRAPSDVATVTAPLAVADDGSDWIIIHPIDVMESLVHVHDVTCISTCA